MALQSYTATVGNLVDDSSGSNYGKYKPVYVKRLDGTNASIFEDFDGNIPIVQDGIQNISNQKGEFTFFVEAGDYNIDVGSGDVRVSIAGADYFNNKIEDLNRLFKTTSKYIVDVQSIVDGLIVLPFAIPDPLVIVDGRILPDDGTFYTVNSDSTEIQLNVLVAPDSNVEIRYSNIVETGVVGSGGDPINYGGVYGTVDDEQRALNTVALQSAHDANPEVYFSGLLETDDSVIIASNKRFVAPNRSFGVVCYHPTNPAFIDATISSPDSQGNNIVNVVFSRVYVRSVNSNCFHITPYQCKWEGCFFQAGNGKPFRIHDGGYQVENKWVDNYFYRFTTAVEASEGGDARFRKLTDAYFKDNYYYTVDQSEFALDLYGASGLLIDGDHYYGDYTDHMVRTGGINVRIVNAYFEAMDRPRLYIQGGNPSSVTVSSCSFWGGSGTGTNSDGDPRGLITIRYSPFNRSVVTFSGNSFEGGASSCPIFLLRNGDHQNSRFSLVQFDKSNILNGSYTKAVKSVIGDADNTWSVQSDHPEFELEVDADSVSVQHLTASKILINDTSDAEEFWTLPFETKWLGNGKEILIQNLGAQTTIKLSSGGSTFYNGDIDIAPQSVYKLTEYRADTEDQYRLTRLAVTSDTTKIATYTTVNPVTLNFGGTSIPAQGELRSLIPYNGGELTSQDDVFIFSMKGLPVGVSATVYFDGTAENKWKVKLVNSTSSAVTITSTFGILTVFSLGA